eukprot:13847998-Heterocapsa_arctica.AAC.1
MTYCHEENTYGAYGKTACGGNNCKNPISGKTCKERVTYGHKKNIGNVGTRYSRLYQPRQEGGNFGNHSGSIQTFGAGHIFGYTRYLDK